MNKVFNFRRTVNEMSVVIIPGMEAVLVILHQKSSLELVKTYFASVRRSLSRFGQS